MPYVLNVLYMFLIVAASPWLLWSAVRKVKYRKGYAEKFLGFVPRRTTNNRCVWLHAVSVGEVNLLAPLLRMIARGTGLAVCHFHDDPRRDGVG